MDSFFKQRFNAAKCKTLVKLSIPRIKLLRNRREIQLKQMRRDIAKLLETGQEATARIRIEHIIREEKMMAAQEIVELFCELISVRLPIIEVQRECPLDLKEAISTICFAAPRCADLPELLQVQMLFAGKYGKEFVAAATELMPECCVNRQVVELLSIRAPAPDVKLKLLKEIAEEHQLDWDLTASEIDMLKPHEDLLNGPTQFVTEPKLPVPNDNKVDDKTTISEPATYHSDSDEDFDIINFPDVPKQPLDLNKRTTASPEMLPFPSSALSEIDDQEEPNPFGAIEPEHITQDKPVSENVALFKTPADPVENKQFLPFTSLPSQTSVSFLAREEASPPPCISKTQESKVDLQDVLAAAHAAAESAERAAAAARSAASIAQLRISELIKQNTNEVSSSTVENQFYLAKFQPDVVSPNQSDNGNHSHQPQRLPSMDDETYPSYPNLFTSQGSNLSSPTQSFTYSK